MSKAAAQIAAWRRYPAQMVHDLFGVSPDAWQLDLLEAFASSEHRRIAMQACAGPGKSAGLAWCGWNFLLCYGDTKEHPKGAAVSITRDNLRDNLWTELNKWRRRSPLLEQAFEWTKERIYARDHESTWWLSARSFPKTASPDEQGATLSGLHSKYMLYLVDESGGIPTTVLRAAEQGIGGTEFGKILQAGNPVSHDGMLYAAAHQLRHQWHLISITGDPDDPKRSPRIDIEWARQQIENYGRDNPWVMALILGKFPPTSINALLAPDEINDAMGKHLPVEVYGRAAKVIGVDVADQGDDRTVLFPRQGKAAFAPVIMRNSRPTEIAARIAAAYQRWDADAVVIDDTGGWALGVMERLDDANVPYIPINFSGRATDPRYYNVRAEMHYKAAEWVKAGGALPLETELVAEACAPTYTIKGNRFLIEPKEAIKERIGRSPDLWDAFILTLAVDVQPKPPAPLAVESTEPYDPYAAA